MKKILLVLLFSLLSHVALGDMYYRASVFTYGTNNGPLQPADWHNTIDGAFAQTDSNHAIAYPDRCNLIYNHDPDYIYGPYFKITSNNYCTSNVYNNWEVIRTKECPTGTSPIWRWNDQQTSASWYCDPITLPDTPPINKPVKTLGQPTCDSINSTVGDN